MAKRTRDEPPESRFDGVLGGSRGYGLPAVRTLSDEYRDVAEPEDSERVPRAEAPGILQRITSQARDWARRLRRTPGAS
jgi:hypothetical protein